MSITIFNALSIAIPSVMGATIIVVPSVVAATETKPEPVPPEPVIKQVKLDKYGDNSIYSKYITLTSEDEFVDFNIDLTLLVSYGEKYPFNFLQVLDESNKPLELSGLINVFLDDTEIESACYEYYKNGFHFTHPIFNVELDKQLTGRVAIKHPLDESKQYHFVWREY